MENPSAPTGGQGRCRCGRPVFGPLAEPLVPRICRAAAGPHAVTFIGSAAGGPEAAPVRVAWEQLHKDARAAAAALQARGVAPGDHVALLGPTSRALVTAVQAIWLAGGCMIMLPIPLRFTSVEDFMQQTRSLLKSGNVSLLLIDPEMAAFYVPAPGDPPVVPLSEIQPGGEGALSEDDYRAVPDDPCRLAVLQFTSGSTAEPKGVMLPHHVIGANIDGMVEAAKVTADDTIVSWLPLYHDMGLIGMLTVSMTVGCSLVLASPLDFTNRPGDWMRWMSEFRGTITAGPNFSWVLATRALKRMNETGEKLDLSLIRIALNGAEPVDPLAVENFIAAALPHGFRPGAEFCAFGMAEVAIGGSFPPPMRGMICDAVDRVALEREGLARPADPGLPTTRRLPLLGRPVPGLEMRICDPATGDPRGEREVGELEIRGASVTTGYYGRPDLTAELFRNEWLRTGDLAYFAKGPDGGEPELVICGRIKDVIIISGRNIYPEDIERAVGMIEGVRAGNVIAFGVESARRKESIVVVAEVRGAASLDELRRAIRRRVIEICEVPPRDIVLVQPGTLPKTSSGKLQRSLCRKQYLGKELRPVE
ncbi:MAG TPA: AMP-binding protein [Bacillota bacterium]|jgi:fatty-acyl-CoA synthase|nr:AMP-binding protein [Bacillota bacterium]HOA36566.1 AMP-binding protein [Bacillota bacterium]HPZ12559.1 AMP-binding protein [Bacillota bacterium]HQE10900.1 AMP-binding protein [Bacillota bacterium]